MQKIPSKLPRGVWMLGLVSLFMDMSSEMAHAILPLFLVGTLGATVALVGLIEGLAEALAQVVKLFSGVLSDRVGSRKWLAVAGYGLSAVTKPLFPLAGSAAAVLTARLADRLGKGIRGAPRDAMVADFTPPELRGAAFGLRQALDTVGAMAGPLIAVGLLWLFEVELRTILWWACVPAIVAVTVLIIGINEPESTAARGGLGWREVLRFANPGRAFWLVLLLGTALSAARMSEAFLVLKAGAVGTQTHFIPLVMVLMSAFYLAAVYPTGVLADRVGAKGLLLAGAAALGVADLVLAWASTVSLVLLGIALWGLHMGLTQGLFGKLVADMAPPHLRGTCFGYFNLASGLAMLLSNVVAGWLWDVAGAPATFYWGAGLAALSTLLVVGLPQPESVNP
jgi:MFS family permease